MAKAFMRNFRNARWLRKIIRSTTKLHLSSTAAVISIILVYKIFRSLWVKSRRINRCAHLITRVKVAIAKSACKKSWVHSEIWGTDQAQLQATTHHTRTIVEMKVVDGRSILWRWREIRQILNMCSLSSSLEMLIMGVNSQRVIRVQELEAHVRVLLRAETVVINHKIHAKLALASWRPMSLPQEHIFTQTSNKLSKKL